jgi:hypothetical protein
MANSIKYSESSESLALNKGNWWIGTGDSNKGPTVESGYWNAINPPSGGYTVYLNKESNGPSIHSISSDGNLISFTNKISGQNYTTVAECLVYYQTQNDKLCVNREYENIVTDGLVLNLDAGYVPSYPTSGTTLYDVSGNGKNGTLTNGPTFSGGSLVFDGTNDWLNIVGADRLVKGKSEISMGVMVKLTSLSFLGVVIGVPRYNCTKNIVIATFENGNLFFYNDTTVSCAAVALNGYLELNKWIYIVGTFNGTTTSLYAIKDGVLSSTSGTLVTGTTNDFDDYNVFGVMGRGSNNLGGNLSNVFVYDRAISESEILQNYNAIKGRFGL